MPQEDISMTLPYTVTKLIDFLHHYEGCGAFCNALSVGDAWTDNSCTQRLCSSAKFVWTSKTIA